MKNLLEQSNDLKVGALVAEHPIFSSVFEAVGIDYCCGGKKTLSAACREKGLSVESVSQRLETLLSEEKDEVHWLEAPIGKVVDHIVETHHAYLKEELPRLSILALKVARVHGTEHPFLLRLSEAFDFFKEDLEQHMQKEERVLFPMAKKYEEGVLSREEKEFLSAPVEQMEFEHEEAGSLLEGFRQITSDYTLPPEACGSFRALYGRLRHLTEDMHRHVHLENEILFPRLKN